MRPIDADELMEHVWHDRLDSRELIAKMINDAPTIEREQPAEWVATVEIDVEQLGEIVSKKLKEYIEHGKAGE